MAGKNFKKFIQVLVLFGIGILFIWLTVKLVGPEKDKIFQYFEEANYFWIVVSMAIAFLSHFFRAYRWNHLLNPLGCRVNLFNATCHVIIGYFANYLIPRMGEVSRCTLAAKYDKVPFEVGFGTVITERIVDFILFILIFLVTLAVQFNELISLANKYVFDPLSEKLRGITGNPVKLIVLVTVVILFVGCIVFLRKKLSSMLKGKFGNVVKGLGEGIGSIRKMEKPFQFIVLSLLIWASYFYALYVCFFSLTGTSHLGQKEALTLLLFGTLGVIFSPGGLGAYPAILAWIMINTYNVEPAAAIALPWLSWTSQFLLLVVLGLASLVLLPIYNRNKNELPQSAS